MNNRQLRALMKRHRLSTMDVARMTEVSQPTVRAWLRTMRAKAHRKMPAHRAERLRQACDALQQVSMTPDQEAQQDLSGRQHQPGSPQTHAYPPEPEQADSALLQPSV